MSVALKMNEIMQEVKKVSKDGKIAFGQTKYSFMSDAAVIDSVRDLMVGKGLVMFPVSTAAEVVHGDKSYLTKVEQAFKIVDTEDGDEITVMTAGEGYDSADKGAGKAMTNARKYALIQTFMLIGDDPDYVASDTYHAAVPTTTAAPGDVTFEKGKYPGEKISDVFAKDPGYVEWTASKSYPISATCMAFLKSQS